VPEDGENVELVVERVVPGGDGLARMDGAVVLIGGGLPGDVLTVRLARDGPRLYRGTVVHVVKPSPQRRPEAEVCPRALAGACGGCDWPAATLAGHRELKVSVVHDALRRVGKLAEGDLPPFGWIGSPRSYRLRNRLHVDSLGRVGFYAPRSNDVDRLEQCEIVSETLLARLPAVSAVFASAARAGELETLEGTGGTPLVARFRPVLPVADPGALAAALLGPLDGIEILRPGGESAARLGKSHVDLDVGDARFRVSAASFFQGNRFLLLPFLDEARRMLRLAAGGGRAVDLYAGGGFLTRPLLELGFRTTAVEVDRWSSVDLQRNLSAWALQGIGGGTAVRTSAEEFISRERSAPDVVVIDPPRAGMSPEVRKALRRLQPRALLLVACDPATFARDMGEMRSTWRIRQVTLLDLFPGTHHVESMALLERE
jgi:23S rRNA (uracil1939-C5)-methyltransferase